jgi:uncharacterized Zn finger protein (UPF0148 family)
MTLCPNCNNPFEEKAGKLFCKEHGWHKQNEACEIVPAEEPTAAEITAAEKTAEADLPAFKSQAETETAAVPASAAEPVQAVRADHNEPPAIGLAYGDKVYYVLLAVAGVTAIGILGYTWYRHKKANEEKR